MDKFKLYEVLLDEDLNMEINTDVDIDAMIKGMMVIKDLTDSAIKAFIDCNEKNRFTSFILNNLVICSLLSFDDPYAALEDLKAMALMMFPVHEEDAQKLKARETEE